MERTTQKNVYRRKENVRREFDSYIDGNVVRKTANIYEVPSPSYTKEVIRDTGKNKEKSIGMNLGYVVFLTAALVFAAAIIISHIRVQADITVCVENIADLESELNSLKLSNDEEYNRATSSIDLEEIRSVAIGELGMRYAKEGQIINVSGEGSDYVRQLAEIGE